MISDRELMTLHAAIHGGAEARVFAAPGRVNLIGEHTDYCEGFVMPAAIDFSTRVAVSARTDGNFVVHSVNFDRTMQFTMDEAVAGKRSHWSDYPAGTLWSLREEGVWPAGGVSLTMTGNVPLGAGLSSSASVESAVALAILSLTDAQIVRERVAAICQRAENGFVGANCGIMDQFVICCGVRDHALLLDCRTLEFALEPIPVDARLLIFNSMVRHSVADGAYNTRRAEIEEGVGVIARHRPEVRFLRDATMDDLAQYGAEMRPEVLRRCRHIITENARVLAAGEAFRAGDLTCFGALMGEAHASMRDDFEASCAEVDVLVALAQKQTGCWGARMTGGGFGGCVVALVRADAVAAIRASVVVEYKAATGVDAEVYESTAADGAREVMV